MEKNFKKALALLTAIAIVGGANYVPQNENFSIKNSISVSAESINGELSYEVVGEEVVITGVNGEPKNIIIPEEIEGYPVTSIGEYAFAGCSGLKSISIPDSVTSIGDFTFIDCSSLTSISISNSVTSMGNNVFIGCSSLRSISIPNSVTNIGEYVFYGCSSLESVSIPDSVTIISFKSFYGCNSLKSVIIPRGVDYIGKYALGYIENNTIIEGFKIYGYANSAAQNYAEENGMDFIDLDGVLSEENNYDVDGNVKVTALDLVKMKKQILGYETQYAQTADVNKDGTVDSLDLVAMIKYLLEN